MNERRFYYVSMMSVVLLVMLTSCATSPSGTANDIIGKYADITASCYEVVVRKPVEDSLVYDKPLNWDLVDYRVREDEYAVLGTAFAINETDLVTAAHVMQVDDKSITYPERFIRERRREGNETVENIYEIDQVKGYDNKRDYIVFTLKDKHFDNWIPSNEEYSFNTRIYTAGNAYGEGLVIREGLLLDTLAERNNGEWEFLKSSIATNPGNSGGPLLNGNFEVIGVVLSKKDDFCYSLPIKEINYTTASHRRNTTFGFVTFNHKYRNKLDIELPLPVSYDKLSDWIYSSNQKYYVESMDTLMGEYAENIFPKGDGSRKALYLGHTSRFPQIFLEDSDDLNWFSSNLKPNRSDLGENGRLEWAETYKDSGVWLMDLRHPDSVSPGDIHSDPQLMMDLILQGVNIDRKLTKSDPGSRIVSYGKPMESERYTDRWGRTWDINVWLLQYLDRVVITLSMPTPRGVSLAYTSTRSAEKEAYLYDVRTMADFINVSFGGTLDEWKSFMDEDLGKIAPLEQVSVEWKTDDRVTVSTADYKAVFPKLFFPIAGKNEFYLFFDFFVKDGEPVCGIRKSILDDGEDGENYLLLYRWQKPGEGLPDEVHEEWRTVVLDQGYPYDGKPFYEDGRTGIGAILPAFIAADGTVEADGGYVYTIFLAGRGEKPDDSMQKGLALFKSNIQLLD